MDFMQANHMESTEMAETSWQIKDCPVCGKTAVFRVSGSKTELLEAICPHGKVIASKGVIFAHPKLEQVSFDPSAAARELGRRGGSKKSPEKARASRANGMKGGRPKKIRDVQSEH